MKTWKRLFSCLLAGAMALSLAACGGDSSSTDDQTAGEQIQEETTSPADTSTDTAAPEDSGGDTAADSGNVLVVYYSATGNTETVANYIAEATGGDIFEITPAEPYTDDDLNWSDENSRVTREHEDESLRDVEANDFTGKTVIPFCTSSSSGLGESGELLAELAASGDWQEGQRFRSSVSQEDVNEWVDSLGLSAE